jgi:hypothetical protein
VLDPELRVTASKRRLLLVPILRATAFDDEDDVIPQALPLDASTFDRSNSFSNGRQEV